MEKIESDTLQNFTIDLTQKAEIIKKQINNQSLLLETIQYQANKNEDMFLKNSNFFEKALIELDKDKRNHLILFLILIIIVLIYIIRN